MSGEERKKGEERELEEEQGREERSRDERRGEETGGEEKDLLHVTSRKRPVFKGHAWHLNKKCQLKLDRGG